MTSSPSNLSSSSPSSSNSNSAANPQTPDSSPSNKRMSGASALFRRFSRLSPSNSNATSTPNQNSTSSAQAESNTIKQSSNSNKPQLDGVFGSAAAEPTNGGLGTDDKKDVWLDCDIGHDDAIALLLALFLPNINLLGVSTVSGNGPSEATFANAARCLAAFRAGESLKENGKGITTKSIPLFRGSDEPLVKTPRADPAIHGEDGLGGVVGLPSLDDDSVQRHLHYSSSSNANQDSSLNLNPSSSKSQIPDSTLPEFLQYFSSLLKERVEKGKPKLHLAVTGPMTNIALFYKIYPNLFVEGIEQVVVMGGAAGVQGNRGPLAEFNILVDPEAASIIFNAPIKVVMCGLNVTHQAIFTPSLHDRLLRGNSSNISKPSPPINSSSNKGSQSSSPPSSPTSSQPSSPNFNTKPLPSTTTSSNASSSSPPSNLRKLLSSVLLFFASTYSSEFGFKKGPPIHDMLTIGYISDPSIFYKNVSSVSNGKSDKGSDSQASSMIPPRRYRVDVECNEGSLALGATVVDFYGDKKIEHEGWGRGGRNVEVLEVVSTRRLWNLFFKAVDLAEDHISSVEASEQKTQL